MNLFRFKPMLLVVLFFWQAASQPPAGFNHFRYKRAIALPSVSFPSHACAILDGDVFAHAAPTLKDLRLYDGSSELLYTTTVSEPPQQDTDEARVLNLDAHAGRIVFDLEMPARPYTRVVLDLAPRDFIATATVSGSESPGGRKSRSLGTFTLFDLTSQHLLRSTAVPLPESTFAYLHIELALTPAPGSKVSAASLNTAAAIRSVTVPPSREAQSLYSVAEPPVFLIQSGHDAIATFKVAARVPIERIAFTLPPSYKGDFSRNVRIEARGIDGPGTGESSATGYEEASGTILRVHKFEAGQDLSAESLTLPVAIGSNMQQPATVEIHVEDGSDAPPPLSVQLQMRQRRICFNTTSATGPLTLYYGDSSLEAPAYENVPVSSGNPRIAQLAPESLNPTFSVTPWPRRTVQHRPVLRWIALLGCVCIFALLVIRSRHKRRR